MNNNYDDNRRINFIKDANSEQFLKGINNYLLEYELKIIDKFESPQNPIIFIVGVQRTGSTLLTQLLTKKIKLFYPNNFIARFWEAPYIGSMFFKSIYTDMKPEQIDLKSDLGYTKGIMGAHEFGYFWRRWFPNEIWEKQNNNSFKNKNILLKELSALESVFNLPLIFKNLIVCSFHITELSKILPNAIFVNIERNPIYTVQSTYESRVKLYGDENLWFGLKPPEYPELVKKDIFNQIAGQIFFSEKYIRSDIEKIEINRKINIKYENLIENPLSNIEKIISLIKEQGFVLKETSYKMPKLESTNYRRLDNSKFSKLEQACKNYWGT